MTMKKMLSLVLLTISLFMFAGCEQDRSQPTKIKTVKTEYVEYYDALKRSNFPGKVKASSEIRLSFRIAGQITRINITEGEFVKKDQVVAELDARDYTINLSALEAQYWQVKSESERIIELHKRKSVSDNDYDKAVSGLQQITSQYEAAKNALNDTKLVAPFDGFIQKRFYDKGEVVGEGIPVFSMISADLPDVEINIPVGEFVKRDMFASFSCTFDVFARETFPLELISINEKANSNQLYSVRFRIKKGANENVPTAGMSAMVKVEYKPEDNQRVWIPVSAIRNTERGTMVWIYNNQTQKVEQREITIAQITNHGKAIVSNGLKASEIIVTAGVHSLTDGEIVDVLPEVSPTNVGGLL